MITPHLAKNGIGIHHHAAQGRAVARPDLVVAFPGGRGTADMVRRATAAGIEVIRVSA